nr:integrase, catalytic region, zinc finger, CCHC-type, peptidase aspartic, catalytic [Tanacetum cinerariifolium]
MFVEFVIQNQYFSFSLEDFAQILRIPCEGACVFSNRWSLDELVYGAPSEGPYQTNLPFPDDIVSFIREDREGQVTRIRHQKEVESEKLESIMAREEVVILLPPLPLMNHLHLISTMMMMEIVKGPRVQVIQLILWIVDSRCSKHMIGNLQLLRNFIEKFMGTVLFGNDHFTAITDYADYVQGNLTIFHGKSKKASLPPKLVPRNESKLELLHMDLCGPMWVASINDKKYILVIIDDYSRTKKIMETIHVKFDDLTAMNCTNFTNSSKDSQSIPSKSDLDNLFGPLHEEYYATSSQEVSNDSAANTTDNEHTSSSSKFEHNSQKQQHI